MTNRPTNAPAAFNYLSGMSAYPHSDRLLIAVDCIIFGFVDRQLQVLVVKREHEQLQHDWSLMGGWLHREESLDEAAARVLRALTGLTGVFMAQHRTFGEVRRDTVERTVSVGYYALVDHEKVSEQLSDEHSAHWVPVYDLPSMLFDHDEMVATALNRLRYRATHEPIAFRLLPERFTLSDLQRLYEAIFATDIDAGNFRRRLRKMKYLRQSDEKDLSTSKKGAYYYSFDRDAYQAARDEGAEFLLKP